MTIPDFQTIMRPILAALEDGQPRPTKELIQAVSDQFGLTPEERAELIPSGKQRRIDNKVHWAVSHMFQAKLVDRPARARVQITETGRAALATNQDRIDMRVLQQYPSYVEFRNRTKEKKPAETGDSAESPSADVSPQDLLDSATAENRAAIEGELLTRALALTPTEFELLVVRLLEAMGYGQLGAIEHSGKPGDGGIDGIISQDPLGLDRIYLQAKRYDPGSTVSRPDLQKFVGALMGAQGDRGVFLTTSSFTAGAIQEAERVNARIELIDGRRLARLMIRHGVGVQAGPPVMLYAVDEDFFESL